MTVAELLPVALLSAGLKADFKFIAHTQQFHCHYVMTRPVRENYHRLPAIASSSSPTASSEQRRKHSQERADPAAGVAAHRQTRADGAAHRAGDPASRPHASSAHTLSVSEGSRLTMRCGAGAAIGCAVALGAAAQASASSRRTRWLTASPTFLTLL